MFGFGKKKPPAAEAADQAPAVQEDTSKSWLQRLRGGLQRTRAQLGDGLGDLLLGKKDIDAKLEEQLETVLLQADVGVKATAVILERLRERLSRSAVEDNAQVASTLRAVCDEILEPVDVALDVATASPFVILTIGINGSGKTTSIAKLAHEFSQQGKSVMLAAGDTFRAAAVEQLQVWGERNSVPVIAQHTGADSAAVIFDAIASARAKNIDVLIADTAGRLHTQNNLMEELKKIKRVAAKALDGAPHETLLVIDGSQGQNSLAQAREFNAAIGVDGLCVTKLDGSSKGGIVFAIAEELKLPIRYIGVGETASDLQPFKRQEFIAALFA